MPLAPSHLISHWYQPDSFVYRSFMFLFQNPLYSVKVPNGFSLCPFFWLSLFSFFIFRPLVYVTLLVKLLAGVLHLTGALKRTDRWVADHVYGKESPGVGLFTMLFTVTFVVYVAFSVTFIELGTLGHPAVPVNHIALAKLVMLCIPSTWVITAYHLFFNHVRKCKVLVYLPISWAILFLIGLFVAPHTYLSFFILWPAHYIAVAAMWVYSWFGIHWLLYHPVWFLYAAILLGVFMGLAYLFEPQLAMLSDARSADKLNQLTRKERLQALVDVIYGHVTGDRDRIRRILSGMPNLDHYLALIELPFHSLNQLVADYMVAYCAWLDKQRQLNLCQRATRRLGVLLSPLTKNLGAFTVTVAALIKAAKQGACPYYTFKQPADKAL